MNTEQYIPRRAKQKVNDRQRSSIAFGTVYVSMKRSAMSHITRHAPTKYGNPWVMDPPMSRTSSFEGRVLRRAA